MSYLSHSEIKEKSIIMIEQKNGTKEPYFIARKEPAGKHGGTKLLGQKLSILIENPKLYPCTVGSEDNFYTGCQKFPDKKDKSVNGYRKMNPDEKDEWHGKISAISHLKELVSIISNS